MSQPADNIEEDLTPGLLNAMNRGKVHRVCPSCFFPLPAYPGRYPKSCPHCGKSVNGQPVGPEKAKEISV